MGFLKANLHLLLPLWLSLWMAWIDLRTNRIPNYLTLGTVLGGLAYQLGVYGWAGLGDGLMGVGLGFGLLIVFYLRGGLGAGDVKALAALGAWLGPWQTLQLFIFMAFSGVLLIVAFLWWRGLLWDKLRLVYELVVNLILVHSYPSAPRSQTKPAPTPKNERMPYALAIALGMTLLCLHKLVSWP